MQVEQAVINVAMLWMLTVPHEFAHAWVATKLGDDTPTREGRVTLYPLAHIDWLGTTILPFITSLVSGGFIGWGKPVRTDPSQLRGGMKGLVLVALAGPAANVVMAFGLVAIASAARFVFTPLARFAVAAAILSIYLAIFNLLPLPPLDGSKLLLAARIPVVVYQELARFGFVLLLVLFSTTQMGGYMNLFSNEAVFLMFRVFGGR